MDGHCRRTLCAHSVARKGAPSTESTPEIVEDLEELTLWLNRKLNEYEVFEMRARVWWS